MWSPERLQEVSANSSERNTTGAEDWSQVYEAVRWIQLVMAVLSVLGSGSIIVCVTSQRLGRTPELQPLLLLSVSDLLLAVCWTTGAALFSERCSSLNTFCYHLHTVEQVLYMASFFYTLNYVLNLYTGIRDKFYSCINGVPLQESSRATAALLSGLFPVLLMTPVFIQGNVSQCQANFSEPYRCLLMHTGALYLTSQHQQPITACSRLHTYRIAVFLATFLLTLLSIIVLVVKARHFYRRVVTSNGYLGNQQRASFRLMDRRMLLYPLIFVLCWGPGLRLLRTSHRRGNREDGEPGLTLSPSCFLSGESGFSPAGEALSWSGSRRRRPLHISGLHLGLSGFPQLSGLRMDAWTTPPGRQEGFVSRPGHSDASAEITEEDELPNTPHRLKETDVTN